MSSTAPPPTGTADAAPTGCGGPVNQVALTELQEVVERPEETDHVLRLGLHRLPITEFPHVRALAPALASYDGAAELDRGLDLLLPSLAATLSPTHGSPRTR